MEFGELETVRLSEIWKNEAIEFTPWLAEQSNLDKLAREADLPTLELEGTEVLRGKLKPDIVAKVTEDERKVVIENQIYEADFDHLGRIVAYVSAFEADIVVWVAESFRRDILSAVKLLNDNSGGSWAFFAVRLKVYCIGDSLKAPKFEVLERPQYWQPQVHLEENPLLSARREARRGFWKLYAQRHPEDRQFPTDPIGSSYWVNIETLSASLNLSRNGVGIFLSLMGKDKSPEREEFLNRCNHALEQSGLEEWDSFEGYDSANWPEMADRLHQKLLQYREVIGGLAVYSSAQAGNNHTIV